MRDEGEPREAVPFEDVAVAVELAIGDRIGLAASLAASGVAVTAMDIARPERVPQEVTFVRDDLNDPDVHRYEEADVLYARRLPEELQRPAARLARDLEVPLFFTTLGFELPVIDADPVRVGATTWHRLG